MDTPKKAAAGGFVAAVVAVTGLYTAIHGTHTTETATSENKTPVVVNRPHDVNGSPLPVTVSQLPNGTPLVIVGHGAPGGCEPPFCHVGALKTAGCKKRANGALPDPACTPGAIDPRVTQENLQQTICKPGYTATVRNVSAATKRQVVAEYDDKAAVLEIDHFVSLELGGSNDLANLWPEDGKRPNPKDAIENRLHREVCAGTITLADAQLAIATDWRKAH